jgi:hypothetical protein
MRSFTSRGQANKVTGKFVDIRKKCNMGQRVGRFCEVMGFFSKLFLYNSTRQKGKIRKKGTDWNLKLRGLQGLKD